MSLFSAADALWWRIKGLELSATMGFGEDSLYIQYFVW